MLGDSILRAIVTLSVFVIVFRGQKSQIQYKVNVNTEHPFSKQPLTFSGQEP